MHHVETTIAGIGIPDSALTREATEFVREVSTRLLFDHSRRVFLWASLQAERLSLDHDAELLYVGAMFHDVGLLEGHRSEHERFEIDGANAARAFLERHGLPEEQLTTVWESIALHTTRQVPNYNSQRCGSSLSACSTTSTVRTSTVSRPSSVTRSLPPIRGRTSRPA